MEVLTKIEQRGWVCGHVCVCVRAWELSRYICQVYLVNEHVCNANKIYSVTHTHTHYIHMHMYTAVCNNLNGSSRTIRSAKNDLMLSWEPSFSHHVGSGVPNGITAAVPSHPWKVFLPFPSHTRVYTFKRTPAVIPQKSLFHLSGPVSNPHNCTNLLACGMMGDEHICRCCLCFSMLYFAAACTACCAVM